MVRRPPRSTQSRSSAASDVYKRQVLDLAAEIYPVWKQTDAFYGKPWIWNMVNNFGGNTNLFGRIETVAIDPAKALNDSKSGNMNGIGLTMEAIEQNPVIYELMADNTWRNKSIDLNKCCLLYTSPSPRDRQKSR